MTNRRTDEEIDAELSNAIEEGRIADLGWKPVAAKVAKEPRAVYGLRLSAEEWASFSEAAKSRNLTLSEFLRFAAAAAAEGAIDMDQAAKVAKAREKARELLEALA